jgi:outer membrane protein TolC
VSIRLLFIIFLLAVGLAAQEREISVAFEDLPRLLEQSSPQVKIINAKQDLAKAESDAALQWSNPELNFSLEQIDNSSVGETEQLVYLSKTFALPWNYWSERQIWQADINAANMDQRQNMYRLLADTRTGYVRLRLLQNVTLQLIGLKDMLTDLQLEVRARHEEGAMSQLEATLLSVSLFGLESDILETQQDQRRTMSNWEQILGIDSFKVAILTTMIEFKKIPTDIPPMQQILENHQGLKAHQARLTALDKHVKLEKGRILPSISLQGGYKKINPGWEGYTLGFSLPLPLLNWNGPRIEEQKIKYRIKFAETAIYKQKLRSELENLIIIIQNNSDLLQKSHYGLQNYKIAEDLLAVYQEGALSLTEFLNAIQLYRDGSRKYSEQLTTYYRAVFELEALSGQQMVTF